jgi:hypothetical protein
MSFDSECVSSNSSGGLASDPLFSFRRLVGRLVHYFNPIFAGTINAELGLQSGNGL